MYVCGWVWGLGVFSGWIAFRSFWLLFWEGEMWAFLCWLVGCKYAFRDGDVHSPSHADDDAGGDVMLIRSIIVETQHLMF